MSVFDATKIKVVEAKLAANQNSGIVVTAGAYSALDGVGDLLAFPGVALSAGGGGYIVGWTIVDNAQIEAVLQLRIFDRLVTGVLDNAAFAITDADAKYLVGHLVSSTYIKNAATSSYYTAAVGPIGYRCYSNRSLYAQLVCTGTPTYVATTDLVVKLHVAMIN